MMAREMPATRKAELFKKLLGVLWIASIVGLTLSGSGLLDTLVDAPFNPPDLVRRRSLKYTLMIVGWCLIAWLSHRGTRRNLAPPEWSLVLISVLACVVAFL
jgi:hypothetical protein